MDFEKKYWSENEFTTKTGNFFTGYVGIFDGKAYIYATEEELVGNDKYMSRINLSKHNFDRTLGQPLQLPYSKNEIEFAANDFLHTNSLKNIIEKLQDNNDYIFRNAIISNTNLPDTESCTLLASEDIRINRFYLEDNSYLLKSNSNVKKHTFKIDDTTITLYYCDDKNAIIEKNSANLYFVKNRRGGNIQYGTILWVLNEYTFSSISNTYYSGEYIDSTGATVYANADKAYEDCYLYKKAKDCSWVPRIKSEVTINEGILKKYNFAEKALSVETNKDSTFYPETALFKNYFIKNYNGKYTDEITSSAIYIDNPDKQDAYYTAFTNKDPKEVWRAIYGDNLMDLTTLDYELFRKELMEEYTNKNISLEQITYNIKNLSGSCTFSHKTSNNLTLSNLLLDNAYQTVVLTSSATPGTTKFNEDIKSRLAAKILSISLIIKGDKIPTVNINGNILTNAIKSHISDDYYFVKYKLATPLVLNAPSVVNEKCVWNFLCNIASDDDKIQECYDTSNKLKCDLEVQIGTEEKKLKNYKFIPSLERHRKFSYKWQEENNGAIKTHIAPHTYTYGFLRSTEAWLNATNPVLIYDEDSKVSLTFGNYIPEDSMTAEDTYVFMLNNALSYGMFPEIDRVTEYNFLGYPANQPLTSLKQATYIVNDNYSTLKYPIETYKVESGNNIVNGYKSTATAYSELYEINNHAYNNKNFDKIPDLKYENYSKEVTIPKHNFNELVAAEIVVRDIGLYPENAAPGEKQERYAKLLVAMVFKTKVLLLETKYYIDDEACNYNSFDKDNLKINLLESLKNLNSEDGIEEYNYIELNNINPSDESSLQFLNLTAIKIYKNMMYLVDKDLNMVLRYNIEYLLSPIEPLNFNIKSLSLMNILQGKGDASAKIYFNEPNCIDICDDKLYVVDRGNKCVKCYSPSLNFIKVLKNGLFSTRDVQCVAVNPHKCIINGKEINKNSVWIGSIGGNRFYITVLDNDIVVAESAIEDIKVSDDANSWVEEIRNIKFSKTNSNYFYFVTNKRVYKMHVSKPFYPLSSVSYFKLRSLVGTMRWSQMHYPWHRMPSVYAAVTNDVHNYSEITWDYQPPTTSAEILDNKCFALVSADDFTESFEGDLIFHFGILYDNSKINEYIRQNKSKYKNGIMRFEDIPLGELALMVKSLAILIYNEKDSFISSISNEDMAIYDIYKIEEQLNYDYINALTFNKIIHSLGFNLMNLKNNLFGNFRAATNIDNVIVYDNIIFDEYYNNLLIDRENDLFIHDNENVSIIVNRVLNKIYDLQEKIINRMQTKFMAAQSFVNNTSRII